MAYIMGILTEEEEQILKSRGWDVEPPPKELSTEFPSSAVSVRMVWVDSSMFDVMSGPDWDTQEDPRLTRKQEHSVSDAEKQSRVRYKKLGTR